MKIISVDTMRRLEQRAGDAGVQGFRLMCRAGTAAAAIIEKYCVHRFRRVVFFCGGGNNAGDALVCAKELKLPHLILPFRPLENLKGEAGMAYRSFGRCLNILAPENYDPAPGDLMVDALLGIGFKGTAIRFELAAALKIMADARKTVIAFDLPSGLDGDSGIAAPETLPAELTITFGMPKQGMFLNAGPRYCGKIVAAPIGVEKFPAPAALPYTFFTSHDAEALLVRPAFDAHKNSRGRVLMLCGSCEYPGAALLASKGALHFAGIVRTISVQSSAMLPLPAALIPQLLPPGPEGELPPDALKRCAPAAEASQVVCAGCGWGSHVSPTLLKDLLDFPGKIVLDADGLNLLSRNPGLWNFRSDVILTPHPGEALRLAQGFGIDTKGSREEFAARLSSRLGAVIVLKGFHTCVATPDGSVSINGSGGPELAMAGSGDVLAGITAGIAAQMEDLGAAARLAVFLHGAAGDMGRGAVIADDLPRLAAECAANQTWW